MKKISVLLIIISVLLSDVMCASVAYKYCEFLWGAQYAGYSAPPETAFFMAIPYVRFASSSSDT